MKKEMKLIIFCKSKEKSKASKGKTWSRGTNSRLPFKGNVILNLSFNITRDRSPTGIGSRY